MSVNINCVINKSSERCLIYLKVYSRPSFIFHHVHSGEATPLFSYFASLINGNQLLKKKEFAPDGARKKNLLLIERGKRICS